MTFFHLVSYLAPLVAGLAAPVCLILTKDRPLLVRLSALGFAEAAALLLPLVSALFVGAFVPFLKLTVLVAAFAFLVGAFYLFLEACRVPGDVAQLLCGMAVVVLLGTMFWMKPVLDDAEAAGLSDKTIDSRITLALQVNPFAVTSYSIFRQDPGHWASLYPFSIDDFRHGYPTWGVATMGYALTGLILLGASLGLSRLRRRSS